MRSYVGLSGSLLANVGSNVLLHENHCCIIGEGRSNSIIYYSNYCEVKYRQLISREDRHVLDYSLVLDCRIVSRGLYSPKNRLIYDLL